MTTKQQRACLGVLTVAFVVAAVAWTVASAASLSHTFDEPHHLATGIEWWQFGTYRWWTENPPLPKVVTALGPYLAGMRLPARPTPNNFRPWLPGIELLYAGPSYQRTLVLARLGTVGFLLLTLGLTFALAGGRKRQLPAFAATALVATYPPLLGTPGWRRPTSQRWRRFSCFSSVSIRGPSARRADAPPLSARASPWPRLCKLTAPAFCAVAGIAWLAAHAGPRHLDGERVHLAGPAGSGDRRNPQRVPGGVGRLSLLVRSSR